MFTHEAGIHVDGLLKHPDNYQVLTPARWAAATALCWATFWPARGDDGVRRRACIWIWRWPSACWRGRVFVLARKRRQTELLNLLSDEEMARLSRCLHPMSPPMTDDPLPARWAWPAQLREEDTACFSATRPRAPFEVLTTPGVHAILGHRLPTGCGRAVAGATRRGC